ncbi:MAG: phasin family protein [Labrys sp. (in: a-proteobacteria)]
MFQSVDDMQKLGKESMDTATKSFAAVTKGLQAMASEAVDYSKKSYETSTAAVEKIVGAKSLDKAFEAQTEFFKTAYENFVSQTTKMGEMVVNVTKEAYKPYEGMLAKTASK